MTNGLDRRNPRALVAAVLAAVCVLCGVVAVNAYSAGRAEGYARGYDQGSINEAYAWSKIPKVCTPAECPGLVCPPPAHPLDMQAACEHWFFTHNPPVRETFKADPRQAK